MLFQPISPLVSIGEYAVGPGSRPTRQQARTGDHPVEHAVADDLFLHILVVVDALQEEREQDGAVKKATLIATVSGADPRHGDEPLDLGLCHQVDEDAQFKGSDPDESPQKLDLIQ